jgi:ubiquinone/menaquinone biosynthesis C-methylase UbiE
MKRTSTPEYLGENAQFSTAEVQASLADLRMFNRWFGGTRVMRKLMQRTARVSARSELRWLDVAAASGDIVKTVTHSFAADGITLLPVVFDRARDHLPAGLTGVQGDALALPFADESFDVVSTSLLIHDLEPPEIRKFMREALRVARVGVLINELRRSWIHLGLVYAGMPLFSRITRHDAPASVKKAYTAAEIREMVSDGHRYELRKFYLCRMGVIVWKSGQAEQDGTA